MYIVVRYGDSKEEIFNPNCRTHNLLSSIKKKCKCLTADIELSDESGNVKFLRDFPNRYANEILGERETLVLLKVDSNNLGVDSYIPLLDDNFITDDFKARLANKSSSRPGSKRGKSTKRNTREPERPREKSREKQRGSAKTDRRAKSRQGKG